MSSQATVQSVDALKDFRAALAVYGEDTLAAIGAVGAEVRRTVLWLEQNRPAYWHDQIKRRREEVSLAKADVFRLKLQKRPDYSPPMSEQMENLRKAEANLLEAEKRLTMVRKWQPRLQHAVLEYHASIQRLKDLSATDVPNAVLVLGRIVDALEAYLQVQPPSGAGLTPEGSAGRATAAMEAIATKVIEEGPVHAEAVQPAGRTDGSPETAGSEAADPPAETGPTA